MHSQRQSACNQRCTQHALTEAVRMQSKMHSAQHALTEAVRMQSKMHSACTHRCNPQPVRACCNQWQSVAIGGNQWQSVAISGNQWQSMAISGNRWQSVAIGGNQWPSESPTRQSGCAISHQHALRDALPDALSMHSHTSPRLSPRAELRDGRGRATRVGEDK